MADSDVDNLDEELLDNEEQRQEDEVMSKLKMPPELTQAQHKAIESWDKLKETMLPSIEHFLQYSNRFKHI